MDRVELMCAPTTSPVVVTEGENREAPEEIVAASTEYPTVGDDSEEPEETVAASIPSSTLGGEVLDPDGRNADDTRSAALGENRVLPVPIDDPKIW